VRRRCLLVSLLAAALATAAPLTACGSDTASAPTELVPAGSIFYGEATIKPEGDQKEALDALARKLPDDKSPGELTQDLLTRAFRESDSGLSYDEDVKPWLGEKAAFFASGMDKDGDLSGVAALVQTEDEDAARDAVDKAAKGKGRDVTYKDVDYRRIDSDSAAGVVEGYLVAGTDRGVREAVDVVKEDARPLGDSDAYDKALEGTPEDRLGFVYFNTPRLLDTLKGTLGTSAAAPFEKLFAEPYVVTADADSDGVEFVTTLPQSLSNLVIPLFGEGTDLLEGLPGDSWGVLAQPNLGKTLNYYVDLFAQSAGGRGTIEQQVRAATGLDLDRDVIGWMRDFGLFVRGTTVSALGGALVIETSDPAASDHALAALQRQFRREGDASVGRLTAPGGGKGYAVRDTDVPQPIHIFRRGARVVAAYGDAAARDAVEAAEPLRDSSDFSSAASSLGDDYDISTYVAMKPIIDLVDSTGSAASDPDWQKAKPYLEAIGALIGGTRTEGDKLLQKVRLTVP
jgi:Protein of unknown function (DUF3352)